MIKLLFSFLMLVSSTSFAEVTAKSWIVVDHNRVVAGENINDVRPIASITKLVTVMVYLDAQRELNLPKRMDLVERALVYSDNKAARQLCEIYPGGYYDCVWMMNQKARELGLTQTKFLEPTGLSVFNVSTAGELVKIVIEASKYPEIVHASSIKKRNTNPTVGKYDYTVTKTGFINKAGGCIVAMVNDKVVIVLGSKNTRTRIPELEKLLRV